MHKLTKLLATALLASISFLAHAHQVDTYTAQIVGEAPIGLLVSGYVEEGAADRLDKQLTESGLNLVYVSSISYGQLSEVIKIREVIKKHGANTAAIELGCINLCWPILAAGKERYVRSGQLLGLTWFGDGNKEGNDLQLKVLNELNVEERDIQDFAKTATHRTYFFWGEQAASAKLVTKTWDGPLAFPQPQLSHFTSGKI